MADPTRLAIVDELATSDRSPTELSRRLGVAGNLLAHHLDVLEGADLIRRFVSTGDRRRRYVSLRHDAMRSLDVARPAIPQSVLFVCTHNSARSPLASALWRVRTGGRAASAGTHPAAVVHSGAVAAAARAGLDIGNDPPRHLEDSETADIVVTVCDQAHEELELGEESWHWSVPDPAAIGTSDAFNDALSSIDSRIRTVLEGAPS